ncbi:hypothetical protein BC629DRAFT_1628093 [Irpex lacteus]|nr:hypothetical protein BC629DRAFT_1628093 [Irpex lacteus]
MAIVDLNSDVVDCIIRLIYRHDDFSTLTKCTQISTGHHLAEFEALLLVDSSIGPLVRKLRIQPHLSGAVPSASTWITGIPRILPSKLTELQHIELVNIYETGRNCPNSFFHAFLGFVSVERLTVRDVTMGVNLLYAFIASLPKLRHVSVGPMRPLLASVFPYPIQFLEPTFTSLSLSVGALAPFCLSRILGWLAQTVAGSSLRSLSIDVHDGQIADVGEYLLEYGGLLEHLSLNIRPFSSTTSSLDDPVAIREIISLSACKRLQTLTLHGFNPTSFSMLSLIQEISSPDIRELTLEVIPSEDGQTFHPMTACVGALKRNHDLDRWEKLTILYSGSIGHSWGVMHVMKDLETEIRGALSNFRGTLSVMALH